MPVDPTVRLRLLPYIRLSVTTDNTTSPERQMENIQRFAEYKRHDLVEITEADYDLDVSGSVSPFDRPGLGRWLKPDRLDQWDALVVSKLDRISRSLFDFTSLVQFLEAHGKSLIVLEPELDLTTKEGRVMGNILMTFAEYEREVIGARVKEAHDKLVRAGKYKGGSIPFGYRAVKLDKNWGFEPDPEYAPLVAEMARKYVGYESLGSIAKWLNDKGVPTGVDLMRLRSPNPNLRAKFKGSPWHASTVRTVLRNQAVLGAVVDKHGTPLRDDQGFVIYRADPILADTLSEARDIFEKIQARLSQNTAPVKVNGSPLLQIAFCASCGSPMHLTIAKANKGNRLYEYHYYKCHNVHQIRTCKAKLVKAGPLEDFVFGELLRSAGDRYLTEERIVAGRDYSEEMAKLIERTQWISGEVSRARLRKDREKVSEMQALLDVANAELDRFADLEPEPATIERTSLDVTFRDWWEASDPVTRNGFLRANNVRAEVHRDKMPEIITDRPAGQRSIAAVNEPGLHVMLYLGNLGELLRRAGDLTIRTEAASG
jgi:DNA invertase Pin-like site-specific DNA recombinase